MPPIVREDLLDAEAVLAAHRGDQPGLDDQALALLARMRAHDVAKPVRRYCLAAASVDEVCLDPRQAPVLVLGGAGRILGVVGPRQVAAASGWGLLAAEAMISLRRLEITAGGDHATVLVKPLERDGFALVSWRGRLLAAELGDLGRQSHVFALLAEWGRARFG